MRFLLFVSCFIFSIVASFAAIGEPAHVMLAQEGLAKEDAPWFTGPLLTPSYNAVPYGSLNIEPYIFVTKISGVYDNHWSSHRVPTFVNTNVQIPTQIGISKNAQFSFNPQFDYNKTQGRSSLHFGDLPVEFDVQLYRGKPHLIWPTVKLVLRETLPTGNYQRLEPKNLKTDASGQGSFSTTTGFVFGRLYLFEHPHFLNARLAVTFQYSAPVHVRGFNTYGGGHQTAGKVRPGNQYLGLLGFEYGITKNWVLALDVQEQYVQRTKFRGQKGFTTAGAPALIGGLASQQLSLAPAIEYNFDAVNGIIGGAWFTVAGKNSSQFLSWVIAYNYYK